MILTKPRREKSEAYLAWLRTLPCVVAKLTEWSCGCKGPVEAHHIVKAGFGKVGSKPDDKQALPFCRSHHLEYHALGSQEEFEKRYPVILDYELLRLQKAYRPPRKQKREKPCGIIKIHVRCRCTAGSHEFVPSKVLMADGGLSWDCPVLHQRILIE